jgi:uncharacterized membrane protein YhfC
MFKAYRDEKIYGPIYGSPDVGLLAGSGRSLCLGFLTHRHADF